MGTMSSHKHRGTLYCEDNSTAESGGSTTTPQKVEALATKGVESGVTVDTTNNSITIAAAGDYLVTAQTSFHGSNTTVYNVEIYKEGVATNIKCSRKIGTGSDVGSASLVGIITCAVDDDISLYQNSDGSNVMTITDSQLNVIRLS